MKLAKAAAMLVATTTLLWGASAGAEEPVDFSLYFQHPAALSAIAGALSLVQPCSVPIVYDEAVDADGRTLGLHCQGGEDEEISVFVRFRDDGFTLLPASFDYAG